jgi:hypothetical protein
MGAKIEAYLKQLDSQDGEQAQVRAPQAKQNPDPLRQRQASVEHPFGTIQR